jgi:hypothetical protein
VLLRFILESYPGRLRVGLAAVACFPNFYHVYFLNLSPPPKSSMGFFKNGNRGTQLYMRSDAHGERAQKVYALDYCAASFVTEGECNNAAATFFAPPPHDFIPHCAPSLVWSRAACRRIFHCCVWGFVMCTWGFEIHLAASAVGEYG